MSFLHVYFDDTVFVRVYPVNCQFIDLVRQYKILCQDENSGIEKVDIIAHFGDDDYTIPIEDFHIFDPNIPASSILQMHQEMPNQGPPTKKLKN